MNNKVLIVYSFIAIFNAGIDETIIGIIFPEISKKYEIKRQILSLIFLFIALGNFTSLFFSDYLIKKLTLIKLIIITNFFQSLNYLLIFIWGKYINTFYLIYVYMFIIGFTGCFLEIGYNLFVSSNNKNSIIILNILHIFHGLGTITGPILSSKLINYHWYYIYLVEFSISFLLFIYLIIYIKMKDSDKNLNQFDKDDNVNKSELKENKEEDIILIKMFKIPVIIYISLFLIFYLGLELLFGDWFYTYLIEYLNGEKNTMSLIISVYWASQIVGKFTLIIISHFFKIKKLNIISIIIFIIITWICIIFINYNKNIIVVSVLFSIIGFSLGPIHPTILSIINDRFNKNQRLLIKSITICSTVPFLGSSIFPFLGGIIIDNYGIRHLLTLCIILLSIMSICFFAFIITKG